MSGANFSASTVTRMPRSRSSRAVVRPETPAPMIRACGVKPRCRVRLTFLTLSVMMRSLILSC